MHKVYRFRIARLNDRAFPAKRWKLFTGTQEDPRSSSRNALNLSFLSGGTRKACKMESEIKPRNLTDMDGSGKLLTRLTKYPAETRSDNKIKATARASWRHGW